MMDKREVQWTAQERMQEGADEAHRKIQDCSSPALKYTASDEDVAKRIFSSIWRFSIPARVRVPLSYSRLG